MSHTYLVRVAQATQKHFVLAFAAQVGLTDAKGTSSPPCSSIEILPQEQLVHNRGIIVEKSITGQDPARTRPPMKAIMLLQMFMLLQFTCGLSVEAYNAFWQMQHVCMILLVLAEWSLKCR